MNRTQTNIDKVSKPAATTATGVAPAVTAKPAGKPNTAKKKHKKIVFKPNKGGMLALLALVLIVAMIVTAIVFIAKGIINWVNTPEETTASSTSGDPNNQTTLPWNNAYVSIEYANSNKNVGDLILVNNANPYSVVVDKTNLSSLGNYEGFGSYYVIRDFNIQVRSPIIKSLKDMIVALVDANPETLGTSKEANQIYISDAYNAITDESKTSEHHTGLAVNLRVMKPGETGKREHITLRDTEIDWLKAHSAEYGFVIRYDASKAELTGVLDEPDHFRYVGVPHATYMTERGLCLEEYLDLLHTKYTYDQSPLEITAGEEEYLVYYVAANATEGANFTSIPVPPASEGTYTISGDNMNGFIVTVTKTAK